MAPPARLRCWFILMPMATDGLLTTLALATERRREHEGLFWGSGISSLWRAGMIDRNV